MKNRVFDHISPDFEKIAAFGFVKSGDGYSYSTTILDGQFEMRVEISASGEVNSEVIDSALGEPYALHLIPQAEGAFVGAVRAEYERVLNEIGEKCFVRDVFKGDCAHRVIEYVRERYGDELEFLWQNSLNAVYRRKDNSKWYAVLLTVPASKLGRDSGGTVAIIDLRVSPDTLPSLLDGESFFPAYHMNKKHWVTIPLDGTVSAKFICERIDRSYALAEKQRNR